MAARRPPANPYRVGQAVRFAGKVYDVTHVAPQAVTIARNGGREVMGVHVTDKRLRAV